MVCMCFYVPEASWSDAGKTHGTCEVWVRLDEPVSMTWGVAYVAIPRVKLP